VIPELRAGSSSALAPWTRIVPNPEAASRRSPDDLVTDAAVLGPVDPTAEDVPADRSRGDRKLPSVDGRIDDVVQALLLEDLGQAENEAPPSEV